jgi:hypothetical protein
LVIGKALVCACRRLCAQVLERRLLTIVLGDVSPDDLLAIDQGLLSVLGLN